MERADPGGLAWLSTEDIRRKLEGRYEVLEEARKDYAAVSKLLAKRDWLLGLHLHRWRLREMMRQEPLLDEALLHVQRRARMEGWPETLPALAIVREVRTLRTRLEGLARRCFHEEYTGETRLAEFLERLERLAVMTAEAPEVPDEELVQVGGFAFNGRDVYLFLFGAYLAFLAGAGAFAWLGLCVLWAWFEYRRTGRYQVTSRRLILQPKEGPPIQIPLRAINPRKVRARFGRRVSFSLWDGTSFTLHYINHARQLAAQLRGKEPVRMPIMLEGSWTRFWAQHGNRDMGPWPMGSIWSFLFKDRSEHR